MEPKSRTKNIARNTASGLLFKLVCIILPFIVRTILIKKLGEEYAGLNSLFSSILQVLSLSELGFSTVVCFCMYDPIVKNDHSKICALLNLIKKIYRVIGVIILVAGLSITPLLPNFINGTYPENINLYLLYFIYLFNTVVSYFLFAYTGVLLNAHQRSDVENNINLIINSLMYGTQILLLLLFSNYYLYIIILPISTILINLFKFFSVKKIFPDYHAVGKVDRVEQRKICQSIGSLLGHKLSNIAVVPISNIIISAFLGLTMLTIYNNYYYIISALLSIIAIIYTSITPTVGNSIITDNVEKNYRDFNVLTMFNVWFIGWVSICLICLFQPFMIIWMGEPSLLPMNTVILFATYLYLWRFKDILTTYKDAAGMWKADFWKPYVVTIIILVLNIILVNFWGINGSLIACIIGFCVISMPWETHVFFKQYFKKNPKFYYLRMLVYTAVVITVAGITYLICSLLPDVGFLNFLIKCVICLVIPNILFLLCAFRTFEFKFMSNKILSFLKRKKN